MGTKYRVDVSDRKATPVGMNSIRYVGDRMAEASFHFFNTPAGFNSWGAKDETCGVILSEWNDKEYKVIKAKGFD